MILVTRCPSCRAEVDPSSKSCPDCARRLTKARFRIVDVLLYGLGAVLVAFVVSFLIVPVTVLGVILALFARERLHVTTLEDPAQPGDGPS